MMRVPKRCDLDTTSAERLGSYRAKVEVKLVIGGVDVELESCVWQYEDRLSPHQQSALHPSRTKMRRACTAN